MHLPRPWERYLNRSPQGNITPLIVQRDLARIIADIGTPAAAPKRRGKSPGRASGHSQAPRPRQKVIKKGTKVGQKKPTAA